ncbi:MAG: hydrogen peroxide-inducible genes activator [Deltaproteobacteria bacterium]|nr:MAG: hydrogen peroxide-inducible genes activator [Deltaproteobacteria bacterium]
MATLTQLEYIIAVDENKNFSRAAKELNISQPSLSAQIQKVENELDIIIFDRSQKPILTTNKGLDVIRQAKIILREHKKLFDIKNDSGELTGNFHLAVIPSLASYVLPLFVESFSVKYPKVKLKISEYKTEDMVNALYDDHVDGGLLVTPLYDDKIVERVLFYERFFVFTSSDHDLAKKKIIKESDLDANSVWLLEEGHCFRDQVIKVCSLNRKHNVHDNINFESGNLETLINLIRRGKGYTLLPELATMNLPEHELQNNVKKFHKPVPTREVSLVHSRSFLKQDILDALEQEIIANLPKNIKSLKRDSIEVIDI